MAKPQTTFWRLAGMSYLQYVSRATTSLRSALKEPGRRKAMQNEVFSYTESVWANGKQGEKIKIVDLSKAGSA